MQARMVHVHSRYCCRKKSILSMDLVCFSSIIFDMFGLDLKQVLFVMYWLTVASTTECFWSEKYAYNMKSYYFQLFHGISHASHVYQRLCFRVFKQFTNCESVPCFSSINWLQPVSNYIVNFMSLWFVWW